VYYFSDEAQAPASHSKPPALYHEPVLDQLLKDIKKGLAEGGVLAKSSVSDGEWLDKRIFLNTMPRMLSYNEVKPGVAVLVEGEPYVCTWNNIMQKQQRRPVNQTKLRHLIRGNSIEYSFQQSDKLQEAEIETKPAVFIYERNGEWFFHDAKDKSKRFSVSDEMMGDSGKFLKGNTEVETLWFDEKLFRVKLPVKVELKVTEAPPDVRGNTAQGGSKVVELETGVSLDVPMFVKLGDVIRINTETGEYVERV
jgi:elongation factor P